jgi:PAS domain S-box-containing protein
LQQAELLQALQETGRDLEAAQALAHVGNWIYDCDRDQMRWSAELFRILGRDPAAGELALEAMINCYHPLDRAPVAAVLEQVKATGSAQSLEARLLRPDQEVRYLQLTLAASQDAQGQVHGIYGTVLDITQRKQAELLVEQKAAEAEAALHELGRTQSQLIHSEKMSSLGQLVAGVAHEINNPVNFIYGNVSHAREYANNLLAIIAGFQRHYPEPPLEIQELIEEVELDFLREDLPKLLDSMRMGVQRIREIVSSLRTFSRLDEAAMKTVDLHEGIESTLMILRNRLKVRSDRAAIELPKNYGTLPTAECYPGQLNQVLMNILVNALDALEERDQQRSLAEQKAQPSAIWLSTSLDLTGESALIRIRDNGPGIPEPIRDRIFDPFFTTKAIGKGTGMGMSISYQIVTERHGGQLTFVSTPDVGTEFTIAIPVRQLAVSR